jgi:tubulin polyglutamylase TTLL5
MFGYDVLIDADLRPWLLEVNASPSLARGTPLDVRVKNAMIRDIINIIDPAPFDRAAVLRILQRRLGSIAKNRFTVGKNDPDLEQDLRDILGDHTPRRYGETPAHMGNYEMICPNTKEYLQVLKLKKKIIKS